MPNTTPEQIRAFVERVESLEEERAVVARLIAETYVEAKDDGFDVKALREIIKLRKQNPDDRAEAEAVLEMYKAAMGMD